MEKIIDSLSWIDTAAGTVWIVLTIIMFWLLYKVYEVVGSKHPTFYFGVFVLVFVWLYPLYTFLLNQIEVGFVGNIITLVVTVMYMNRLKEVLGKKSRLLIPQIVWLIIATFYVGSMLVLKYQLA